MAKIKQPIGNKAGPVSRIPDIKSVPLVEENLSGGMNSKIEPSKLPERTVRKLLNARVFFDRVVASPGLNPNILPTKPNSNKVLKVFGYTQNSQVVRTYRFDKAKVYLLGVGIWTEVTSGAPISGTDNDRFTVANAFDVPVFANNGANVLQVINPGAGTYQALGNAPKYKYVTVFANRVIGFNNLTTANPIEAGWSGEVNIVEWNPSVDLTAGASPIIDSPGDLNDFITGGVGFSSVMVIFRQRSIWCVDKTPIPTQPFYFRSNVAGIGCDLPYSIAVGKDNKIFFADHRTRDVYIYVPDSGKVSPIGTLNQSKMLDNISSHDSVFGAYDSLLDRYHLCVPSLSSNTVSHWVYDGKTGSWSYDEIDNLSSVSYPEGSGSILKISQLVGKISQLTGKINTLGVTSSTDPTDYYGFTGGEISKLDLSIDTFNNTKFSADIESKVYVNIANPRLLLEVNHVGFDLNLSSMGVKIDLYISKNDGITWALYKTKTLNALGINRFSLTKLITARRFSWKLIITGTNWELINYVIEHSVEGFGKPS